VHVLAKEEESGLKALQHCTTQNRTKQNVKQIYTAFRSSIVILYNTASEFEETYRYHINKLSLD